MPCTPEAALIRLPCSDEQGWQMAHVCLISRQLCSCLMLHRKTGQNHSVSHPTESRDLTVLQNLCYSNFSDLSIKSKTSNDVSHFSRHGHRSCPRRDHLKSYRERNVAGIMLPRILHLRHAHTMVIESFMTACQQWSTMLQSQEGRLCQQQTRYDETNIVIVDRMFELVDNFFLFPCSQGVDVI